MTEHIQKRRLSLSQYPFLKPKTVEGMARARRAADTALENATPVNLIRVPLNPKKQQQQA